MENFKRSTSRDFRINCATLDAALREESSEEDNEVFTFLTQNGVNLLRLSILT